MNIELLKDVRDKIRDFPEKFDMDSYFGNGSCGTTCCIGGWATVLRAKRNKKKVPDTANGLTSASALKISFEEASHLFFDHKWPSLYLSKLRAALTAEERSQVAVELLDTVIKKGRIWW